MNCGGEIHKTEIKRIITIILLIAREAILNNGTDTGINPIPTVLGHIFQEVASLPEKYEYFPGCDVTS